METTINLRLLPSILSVKNDGIAYGYLNSPQIVLNTNANLRFTFAKRWILGFGINHQQRKGDSDEVYVPDPNNPNPPPIMPLDQQQGFIYHDPAYITHTVENRNHLLDFPLTFGYVFYYKKKKPYQIYSLLNISMLTIYKNKGTLTKIANNTQSVYKYNSKRFQDWRNTPFSISAGLSWALDKKWTLLAEPTFYADNYDFRKTAIGLGIGASWKL